MKRKPAVNPTRTNRIVLTTRMTARKFNAYRIREGLPTIPFYPVFSKTPNY